MPRGNPFVCRLSSPGKYRDVDLYIGDVVDLQLDNGTVVRGKIGCQRKPRLLFPYFVKVGKIRYPAELIFKLMPVLEN